MKNISHTFCIFAFLVVALWLNYKCVKTPTNPGNLVFVSSQNSDFEKSIATVTKIDDKSLNFTHVGIVNVTDTGVFVIEAVPEKGVIYSSFQEFLNENKNAVIYTASLKPEYQKHERAAVKRACSHIGKAYDFAFDFENDLYYCSELVYDAYSFAGGETDFFMKEPMTFKNKETDDTLPYWVEYFEKYKFTIPEGKPGVNPTGLSRSEKLMTLKTLKY